MSGNKKEFEFNKSLSKEELEYYSYYFEKFDDGKKERIKLDPSDFSFRLELRANYPTVGVMIVHKTYGDLGGVVVFEFSRDHAEIADKTFEFLKGHFSNGGGFLDLDIPEIYFEIDGIDIYSRDLDLIKKAVCA